MEVVYQDKRRPPAPNSFHCASCNSIIRAERSELKMYRWSYYIMCPVCRNLIYKSDQATIDWAQGKD